MAQVVRFSIFCLFLSIAAQAESPVLTGLGLFLTATVMQPIWQASYDQGIKPYTSATFQNPAEQDRALKTAIEKTVAPIRRFMSRQLQASGNTSAVDLLLRYHREAGGSATEYRYYEDLPWGVLLPAYMLSELKVAFLIGVQIALPFAILDLICGSILSASGLALVPPGWISTPFKLLVFVLIDGWTLVTQALLSSVVPS